MYQQLLGNVPIVVKKCTNIVKSNQSGDAMSAAQLLGSLLHAYWSHFFWGLFWTPWQKAC